MITRQNCNNCIHAKICSFKEEYLSVGDAVENCDYKQNNGHMGRVEDSTVSISVKCPNMMAQSAIRQPFTPKSEQL